MYHEIWFASKSLSGNVAVDETLVYSQTQSASAVDGVLFVDDAETNHDFSSALSRIYSLIGEPDGLHGCGSVLVSDDRRRVESYLREGEWAKAAVTSSSTHEPLSLARALLGMNLTDVAGAFLHSVGQKDSEVYYESALKLSKWDLEATEMKSGDSSFYGSVYHSFASLQRGNQSSSVRHRNDAIDGIVRDVQIIPQSAHALTPILAKLKIVADLEAVQDLMGKELSNAGHWNSLAYEWKRDYELYASQELSSVESVFQLKSTLLRLAKDAWNRSSRDGEATLSSLFAREDAKLTFQLCKVARAHGHYHLAEGGFFRVKDYLATEKLDLGPYWELEESSLYWDRKEEEKAKFLLRGVIGSGQETHSSPLLLPLALCTMGS